MSHSAGRLDHVKDDGSCMGDPGTSTELQDAFRAAMRRLASGVAVVTTRSPEGPVGFAATSVTSLSFDPLAILFCVNRTASFHNHLAVGRPVCINLLSRQQQAVSAVFGSSMFRAERFATGDWEEDIHGSPILIDAQCSMSCTVDKLTAYGTHSIVIASTDAVRVHKTIDPLIFVDGRYL